MKGSTPALTALTRGGVDYKVHDYEHDPAAPSFGDEAATALDVETARVFKTLVTSTAGQLTVAVVPVATTLDLKTLAATLGVKRAEMADPSAAERSTGYVVGAISPIGQKRSLTTVIDVSSLDWPTVFCSGGRRGLEIELTPDDLIRATSGITAAIARW